MIRTFYCALFLAAALPETGIAKDSCPQTTQNIISKAGTAIGFEPLGVGFKNANKASWKEDSKRVERTVNKVNVKNQEFQEWLGKEEKKLNQKKFSGTYDEVALEKSRDKLDQKKKNHNIYMRGQSEAVLAKYHYNYESMIAAIQADDLAYNVVEQYLPQGKAASNGDKRIWFDYASMYIYTKNDQLTGILVTGNELTGTDAAFTDYDIPYQYLLTIEDCKIATIRLNSRSTSIPASACTDPDIKKHQTLMHSINQHYEDEIAKLGKEPVGKNNLVARDEWTKGMGSILEKRDAEISTLYKDMESPFRKNLKAIRDKYKTGFSRDEIPQLSAICSKYNGLMSDKPPANTSEDKADSSKVNSSGQRAISI